VPRSVQNRQTYYQAALVKHDILKNLETVQGFFKNYPEIDLSHPSEPPLYAPIVKLDYLKLIDDKDYLKDEYGFLRREARPELIRWGDIKWSLCGFGPSGHQGRVVVESLKDLRLVPVYAIFPYGSEIQMVTNAYLLQSVPLQTLRMSRTASEDGSGTHRQISYAQN